MAPNPNGTATRFGAEPTNIGRFRLSRATASMQGFTPGLDPSVQAELDHLDGLLQSRIVDGADHRATLTDWAGKPLHPTRYTDRGQTPEWEKGTLVAILEGQQVNDKDETVAEVLDRDTALAQVRYAFDEEVSDRYHELDVAQRAVLDRRGLRDLLVARGTLVRGITNVQALFNFVASSATGVADVVDYALVGAARKWVSVKQLNIAGIRDDDGAAVRALREARLSVTEMSFEPSVERLLEGHVENARYEKYISDAKVTWLTDGQHDALVTRLKSSPVTDANYKQLVPLYAAQIAESEYPDSGVGTDPGDPFQVDFFSESTSQVAISTAAVKCASQLYYVLALGDELGTFDAMRYFTHRYLFQEGFAIEDRTLRRDLEDYVFNEQFRGWDEEAREHRAMHVTHEAERRSFYKQVFDLGGSPLPDGAIANGDFGRLWKILMLESARFLERAQSSPNPDSYVSRQNVMQAVEDLQYNLSTTCVGMATVMTPLMYAELDFLRKRVFGHAEVLKHLAPAGGSWLKVVERLAAAQGRQLRALTLDNKARLGYSIIRDVAKYTPSRFEQDAEFSRFISNVDAFITTQSILQEESGDLLLEDGSEDSGEESGYGEHGSAYPGMPPIPMPPGVPPVPGMPGVPVGAPGRSGGGASQDPWNF